MGTNAGKTVHRIGLGCMNVAWGYGEPLLRDDAVKLFRHALDNGCNHFDTANIYGAGTSEEWLGEAIKGRRDEVFLASKTGIVVDGPRRGVDCRPEAITASLDASLKRLGTDYLDLFYMHRFDPKVPIADSLGAMERAIAAGKIGCYGVSEWSAAHIREAHSILPMAAVQTEYSLWTRNVELGVLDTTRELGIAFVAFSPVARGALAGSLTDPSALSEQDLRRRHPRFEPENWEKNRKLVQAFNALAKNANVSPAQLALAWVLSRGSHVHAIPGTRSIAHWQENHAALQADYSPDVFKQVDRLFEQQAVAGHRYPESIRHTIDTEDFEVAW